MNFNELIQNARAMYSAIGLGIDAFNICLICAALDTLDGRLYDIADRIEVLTEAVANMQEGQVDDAQR